MRKLYADDELTLQLLDSAFNLRRPNAKIKALDGMPLDAQEKALYDIASELQMEIENELKTDKERFENEKQDIVNHKNATDIKGDQVSIPTNEELESKVQEFERQVIVAKKDTQRHQKRIEPLTASEQQEMIERRNQMREQRLKREPRMRKQRPRTEEEKQEIERRKKQRKERDAWRDAFLRDITNDDLNKKSDNSKADTAI